MAREFVFCARCFKTPGDIRKGQVSFNYADTEGRPLCSMACREPVDPVVETARLGVLFMRDTMKMHFLMSIGRADASEPTFEPLMARRVLAATRLTELADLPEVKAVAL